MTRAPLLEARGLSVHHTGLAVLHGVDFQIRAGEIVTVVGPNGSGKTTLLKALLGAVRPDHGRVTRAPGLTIGYVPQKIAVDPSLPLTVARFLDLPRRHSAAEKTRALALTGAEGLEARQVVGLSGGQMQRVLLARALLPKPQLLVLDEATQGLDPPGSAAFYKLLERLRDDTGCAILMVSHELHVVMGASDRVICLNGHICCQGTPEVVSAAPEYRAMFGAEMAGALAIYRHRHDHSHDHGDCGGHGSAGGEDAG